jgi:hypothetical protein
MVKIIKIITSFFNLVGDAQNLKDDKGNIDPSKVENLLNDAIIDIEGDEPQDAILLEKIRIAIDSAIEAVLEAEKNPPTIS